MDSFSVNPSDGFILDFDQFVADRFQVLEINPAGYGKFQPENQDLEDEENWLESQLKWESSDETFSSRSNKFRRFGRVFLFQNEDFTTFQALTNWSTNPSKQHGYLAPKGVGDMPYFPPISDSIRLKMNTRFELRKENRVIYGGSFWDKFEDYTSLPLVITEGAFKALSLIQQGIPAISLFGCSCGVIQVDGKKGVEYQLKETLSRFCSPGRRVILALDNDSKPEAKRKVAIAQNKLFLALKNHGCKPSIMHWSADFKGVDDLIVGDLNHFEVRFEDALYPEKLDVLQTMELKLLNNFGSRIRFNELKQCVELDGGELSVETIKKWWSNHFNEVRQKEDILEVLIDYARKRSYHPVREYITGLRVRNLPPIDLNHLAEWIFGTKEELFNIYLKKQLIAAIARLFHPGCKVDTTLVLQGPQGIGKSSFFRSLALKPQWFDDSLSASNMSDKDEKMKIHNAWILELAELEALYRRKDVAQVRSLISSSWDKIRLPYHPKISEKPRQSTFWASVNSGEFLVDTEGNRRFMVIPIQTIRKLTLSEVESIWLSALTEYESGEVWWLNEVEQELQRRANRGFEESDIWQPAIEDYTEGRDKVTVSEILINAIQMDLERLGRRESDRVIKVLKQLGYTPHQERKGDNRGKRFWVRGIGTQEHSSKTLCSNLCSTENIVPVTVSANWNTGNTANEDKSREVSTNEIKKSIQSPTTDGKGNTGIQKTLNTTESRKDQNNRGVMFHSGSETAESQSVSGLQENQKWNTAMFHSGSETAESQSVSGLQENQKWNTAKNSCVPCVPQSSHATKIDWSDDFKKFQSVKFYLNGKTYQGKLDDQKQEVFYYEPSKNKLGSVWYCVSAKQVELIG